MSFITLLTFDNYLDASPARSLLESHDIYVFLQNEYTATVDPVLKNSVLGVLLQVDEKDYETAKELLTTYGYYREPDERDTLAEDRVAARLAYIGTDPTLLKWAKRIAILLLIMLIIAIVWHKSQ